MQKQIYMEFLLKDSKRSTCPQNVSSFPTQYWSQTKKFASNGSSLDSYVLYVNYPYTHVPCVLRAEFVVKDRNQVYFNRRTKTIWNIHGKKSDH